MKLQIIIPSPSPDLPEEVYNIDCPFCETSDKGVKDRFIKKVKMLYWQMNNDIVYDKIETKYIN